MGQAMRAMSYDQASNERNSVPALEFGATPLQWYRLDDGVMGGKSETVVQQQQEGSTDLHFTGTINTAGGGFTSVRAPVPDGLPQDMVAVQLKFRGDGKTYKVLLSDGNKSTGSPFSRSPSWQIDVPTKKSNDDEWEEITLNLSDFVPSFGGKASTRPDKAKAYNLVASEMKQVGLMLSLVLADGTSNPPETFGEGEFEFSLRVESVAPVMKDE